jgi:hypothetical protein
MKRHNIKNWDKQKWTIQNHMKYEGKKGWDVVDNNMNETRRPF